VPKNKGAFAAGVAAIIVLGGAALWASMGGGEGENPAPTAVVTSTGPVPDFSAAGTGWEITNPEGGAATHYRKVPGDPGPGPVFQHPDYRTGVIGDDVNRIADWNSPILQQWVRERMEPEARRVIAGGIPFIPNSRCWPAGVPGHLLLPALVLYLQTPEQVWILNNRGEVRRVYMDRPHSANPGLSWNGESVGHYENGDSLVIDTIGLDDLGPIDRYNTPHTEALHVIERHTIRPDNAWLTVIIEVEDPGAFTMPWKGMVEFERVGVGGARAEWEEYSCNENSEEYFIPADELVPVPSASRRDF
jgi:hypothetical protein